MIIIDEALYNFKTSQQYNDAIKYHILKVCIPKYHSIYIQILIDKKEKKTWGQITGMLWEKIGSHELLITCYLRFAPDDKLVSGEG